MGWTEDFETPINIETFFEKMCNDENAISKRRILTASQVGFTEAYAAYEIIDKQKNTKEVIALVFLIQYHKNGHFSYKDMSEFSGPYQYNCPEKILKLLTPIDEKRYGETAKYALNWRKICWDKINKRKSLKGKLKVGQVIKFKEPIHFSNGYTRQELTVESVKPLRFTDGRNFFRIRRQSLPELVAE